MTDKPDNVVELHERITVTVTFSPEVSKLIRAEIQRQRREWPHRRTQTPEEIAKEGARFVCEALATK
jgi:hypothetical protein